MNLPPKTKKSNIQTYTLGIHTHPATDGFKFVTRSILLSVGELQRVCSFHSSEPSPLPAAASHDRNITTPRTFNLRFHHIRIPYSCARGRVCGARILGLSEGARSPLRLGHPSGLGRRGRACQGVRINPVRGPLRLRFGRGGQFSDSNRLPEVERANCINYTRMRVFP